MRNNSHHGIFSIFILTILILLFTSITSSPLELDFYKPGREVQKYSIDTPLEQVSLLNSKEYSVFQEELDLINSENDEMKVKLSLGTPPQEFEVLVDSGSFFLWVSDAYSPDTQSSPHRFESRRSSTFENLGIKHKITYGTGMAEGLISKDKVSLGGLSSDNFRFVLVNYSEHNTQLDGILGLGYYYQDMKADSIKFSILDQLQQNGLIKKQLFTQKYTARREGKMYIGELPEEIQSDMSNYGTCPAIKTREDGTMNPRWECTLRGVFYGYENKSAQAVIIDKPALFDTGTNFIVAPYTFLESLQTTYFKTPW